MEFAICLEKVDTLGELAELGLQLFLKELALSQIALELPFELGNIRVVIEILLQLD